MAKVRPATDLVDVVGGSYVRLSKLVAVAMARWPPAEKPTMPMRCGSMPHSLALLRTRLTARWASCSGRRAGSPFGLVGAARHAVLEDDAGHADRVQPGGDLLAFQLPVQVPVAAAGADRIAVPVSLSFAGR